MQGLKVPFPLQLKESLGQFFDKGPGGTVTASEKLVNIMESLIQKEVVLDKDHQLFTTPKLTFLASSLKIKHMCV